MHDRYYATPAETHAEYRWRLQLIAEETVGKRIRRAQADEDAAFARAGEVLG